MMGGCSLDPLPKESRFPASSIEVPFVPPRSELCAATSIEMVSAYWQQRTSYRPYLSAGELDGRTRIPAKGGTLQIELLATARADGLLAYVLEPTFDALLTELTEQHPVIVLVNRGYAWYPLWHYAPVTGYDASEQSILTHFADQPDEAVPIGTFAAIWERSGYWGAVLLPPGHLPASASPKKYLESAYGLEKTGMRDEAVTAYRSALERWPEEVELRFALANALYRAHDLHEAEENYQKLLSLDPSNPLARNNLADLFCRTGREEEALQLLEGVETDDAEIRSVIKATKEEINKGCASLQ